MKKGSRARPRACRKILRWEPIKIPRSESQFSGSRAIQASRLMNWNLTQREGGSLGDFSLKILGRQFQCHELAFFAASEAVLVRSSQTQSSTLSWSSRTKGDRTDWKPVNSMAARASLGLRPKLTSQTVTMRITAESPLHVHPMRTMTLSSGAGRRSAPSKRHGRALRESLTRAALGIDLSDPI